MSRFDGEPDVWVSFGNVLVEQIDGYPARSQAKDPTEAVEWVGPNPPPMGEDAGRKGDLWTRP